MAADHLASVLADLGADFGPASGNRNRRAGDRAIWATAGVSRSLLGGGLDARSRDTCWHRAEPSSARDWGWLVAHTARVRAFQPAIAREAREFGRFSSH